MQEYVPYRISINAPVEAFIRLTPEEESVVRLMQTGLYWTEDPSEQVREMAGDELFDKTMAKSYLVEDSQRKGHVVLFVILEDWAPPLDDIL